MHDVASVGAKEIFRAKSYQSTATNSALPQNWLDFLIESSEEERRILNFGISSTLAAAVQNDRAVYLENFGIVFPEDFTSSRREDGAHEFSLFEDKIRVPKFEKCTELVSFQRDRFPRILEGREFFSEVGQRLSSFCKWRAPKLERYVRGLIALTRYEVIAYGHSSRLSQFGRFLAVHNRQGATERDWLSGADIFIDTEHENILNSRKLGDFVHPVLASAWEPFEAMTGKAFCMFSIKPEEEVVALGLGNLLKDISVSEPVLEAAAYKIESEDSHKFFIVTNGMRSAAIPINGNIGSEIVLPLEVDSLDANNQDQIKDMSKGAIAMAWLLTQLAADKSLQAGIGLSSKVPLLASSPTNFRSILTTPCIYFPREQLSGEGRFHYVSLVLLHPDEAQAVAEVGSELLMPLIKRRRLDSMNRESRLSIFGRTGRLARNLLDMTAPD